VRRRRSACNAGAAGVDAACNNNEAFCYAASCDAVIVVDVFLDDKRVNSDARREAFSRAAKNGAAGVVSLMLASAASAASARVTLAPADITAALLLCPSGDAGDATYAALLRDARCDVDVENAARIRHRLSSAFKLHARVTAAGVDIGDANAAIARLFLTAASRGDATTLTTTHVPGVDPNAWLIADVRQWLAAAPPLRAAALRRSGELSNAVRKLKSGVCSWAALAALIQLVDDAADGGDGSKDGELASCDRPLFTPVAPPPAVTHRMPSVNDVSSAADELVWILHAAEYGELDVLASFSSCEDGRRALRACVEERYSDEDSGGDAGGTASTSASILASVDSVPADATSVSVFIGNDERRRHLVKLDGVRVETLAPTPSPSATAIKSSSSSSSISADAAGVTVLQYHFDGYTFAYDAASCEEARHVLALLIIVAWRTDLTYMLCARLYRSTVIRTRAC
jgi:hypothetical protein